MTWIYVSLIWASFFLICFFMAMRQNERQRYKAVATADMEDSVSQLKKETVFCMSAIADLKQGLARVDAQNEEIKKVAEEVKKLSSETHLAMGFKRLGKRE